MNSTRLRKVLATVADKDIYEFPWGFQATVNGWKVSCHYRMLSPAGGVLDHPDNLLSVPRDSAQVDIILIPMTRNWSAMGAFRRFRTCRSALAYTFADGLQLELPSGPAEVGFLVSGRCQLAVRVRPYARFSDWVTKDPVAVALLRVCFSDGYWRGEVSMPPEAGLLADWLTDHGPNWLVAPS